MKLPAWTVVLVLVAVALGFGLAVAGVGKAVAFVIGMCLTVVLVAFTLRRRAQYPRGRSKPPSGQVD